MAFGRKRKKQAEEAAAPTIEMVLEPGHVKHIHFDASAAAAAAAAAAQAAVQPEPMREPLSGSRSTLYETDRGNQVVAYESEAGRQFATTGDSGERPFDPKSDVDPLVAGVAMDEPVPAAKPSDHIYHPVIPKQAHAAPAAVLEQAWEPTTHRGPSRPNRPPPRQRTHRVRKVAKRVARKRRVVKVAKVKRGPRKPHMDFPGDDHLVIDLEGIGPIYAKRLQKQGVYTTSRLAYESPGNLAKRIKVPRKTVKGWSAMAELIKAKGIGKQYAEVLVRSGVKGIDDLKHRKPAPLAKSVNKFLRSVDSTVMKNAVHEGRAKQWIKAAKKMRRRKLPVPRKGPPQVETVKGFIQKLPKYGVKPKKAKKTKKAARKAAKRTARKATRKASRKASRKGGRKKR